MKTLEHWVLRVADSDLTWIGLRWLRPAKQTRIGAGYILMSSLLLGLPGIAVGASLVYLFCGRVVLEVWASLFFFVTLIELLLHLLFAHCWNRRAEGLARTVKAG